MYFFLLSLAAVCSDGAGTGSEESGQGSPHNRMQWTWSGSLARHRCACCRLLLAICDLRHDIQTRARFSITRFLWRGGGCGGGAGTESGEGTANRGSLSVSLFWETLGAGTCPRTASAPPLPLPPAVPVPPVSRSERQRQRVLKVIRFIARSVSVSARCPCLRENKGCES